MEMELLERIGLTRNESLVYLTLLKLGRSKTGDILNNSGLNSGKIYEILESLKTKGLVSESIINKVRNFSAAPPSQVLSWLDKKKEEIEQDRQAVKKDLGELERMRNSVPIGTNAVTYIGFKGFKTAVEEALSSLNAGEEILGMGITSEKDKKFNEFWLKIGIERSQRKIKAKNLFSERSDFFKQYKKIKLSENRVLEGITPVTLDVFGQDKVLIFNYKEPVSTILIHDKNTATSFRTFFYQLWKIGRSV